MREMIFFFSGRPRALLMYHIILTAVSFASEPELAKKTLDIGTGTRALSFSANSTTGSADLLKKLW